MKKISSIVFVLVLACTSTAIQAMEEQGRVARAFLTALESYGRQNQQANGTDTPQSSVYGTPRSSFSGRTSPLHIERSEDADSIPEGYVVMSDNGDAHSDAEDDCDRHPIPIARVLSALHESNDVQGQEDPTPPRVKFTELLLAEYKKNIKKGLKEGKDAFVDGIKEGWQEGVDVWRDLGALFGCRKKR